MGVFIPHHRLHGLAHCKDDVERYVAICAVDGAEMFA